MRIRLALIAGVVALAAALAVGPALALAADPPTPAFGGPLSGAQEVPAVTTTATGEGTAVVSTDGSTITYYVAYSGLSGPAVAAHIHTGAAGVAGGVILPLVVSASPMVGTLTAANFTPSGAITTFAQAVAAIGAGNTYFNIHTAANPGGEVRGQIGVTLAAPAPSPSPNASPTPAPTPASTAIATVPPTATLPVAPASGGSAVPGVIGILAFLMLVTLASRRFGLRRGR
jgi:CHRD domain